jgi:hypothetical protein
MFVRTRRQVRMLALEAVRRVVADAIRRGDHIDVAASASALAHMYPTGGLTIVEFERQLAQAAVAAKVPFTHRQERQSGR